MKSAAHENLKMLEQIEANIKTLQESTAHGLVVHNGKVLVQVERKAREGDFVVFDGLDSEGLDSKYTINGEFYEVYENDGALRYSPTEHKGDYHVYGWDISCPNPKVYEVIGNLPQSNLIVEAFEPIPVENGTKPPCKHLTANQKRARVIAMAKLFVEDQKLSDGHYRVKNKFIISPVCYADFVRKGNRVTCLMKIITAGKIVSVGRAECHVDDVFNEHIGQAVALAKALDIVEQLPPDILNAVRPDSFVKGMKVIWVDILGGVNERIVERVDGVKVHFTNSYWMTKDEVAIIDDTNVDYPLQGGEN